jgi:hypothetical protein
VDGIAVKKPLDLSTPDTAVVILCPGNGSKLGKPDTFLLPLSASLSAANPPVRLVIGEAGNRDLKTLPQLRSNGALKAATVDGTDAVMGQLSLVLALEAMYRGQIGHYGTGENATSVLPEIAATPPPVAR